MANGDNPTDQEVAADIRKRFNSMAMPIVGLMQECERKGLSISFSIRVVDGKPDLSCDISRMVKL